MRAARACNAPCSHKKEIKKMTSKFVAATMLVVVAGIAAAMTGSSFIEQSRVQSMHSDMHITSIQLHDMHGAQKAFVAFTIVNSGTSALVSSNLSFYDDTDNLTNITLGHINPGESLKERHFVDADINKNGKYILYVNAESANGSELSMQTAVNAI